MLSDVSREYYHTIRLPLVENITTEVALSAKVGLVFLTLARVAFAVCMAAHRDRSRYDWIRLAWVH